MTTPTQAQVEAAGVAYWNHLRKLDGKPIDKPFRLDKDFAMAIQAALTAAAQVGEPKPYKTWDDADRQDRNTTIERCAQELIELRRLTWDATAKQALSEAIIAIRALKTDTPATQAGAFSNENK